MLSYTIDLRQTEDHWLWFLYTQGGAARLRSGGAATIETAIDEAKTQMLVHHRKTNQAQEEE